MTTFEEICAGNHRGDIDGPWRCGEWLVATDGYCIVARKDDREAPPLPSTYTKLESLYLASDCGAFGTWPVAAIQGVCGPVPSLKPVACDECYGAGIREDGSHNCRHCGMWTSPPCDACNGSVVPTAQRETTFFGQPFDGCIIARGLDAIRFEGEVFAGLLPVKGGNNALVIASDMARLVVMQRSSNMGTNVPSFPS